MGKLTPKQEKFCQKYIETGNASEAYRQSYDAGKMKPETINRNAHAQLGNSKIAARIGELKLKLEKRHEITVDRVLKEYGKLAFLDIRKAFDEFGNLRPLHTMDDDTAAAIAGLDVEERILAGESGDAEMISVRVKKIKLSDKRASLDSIARYLGMFKDKDTTPPENHSTVIVLPANGRDTN